MGLFTHGVHLPNQRGKLLERKVEMLPIPEKLYIPRPEKLLEQVQPGAAVRRGQRLWENDYGLPVYSPINGRVEDVVRQNHPLFGDGCYVIVSLTKTDSTRINPARNSVGELLRFSSGLKRIQPLIRAMR